MRTISQAAIIAAGVCVVPFFASAITVEELGAQIQNLLAQIAALQARISATPSSPQINPYTPVQNSSCPQLLRSLSRGAQGSDVLQLQSFLVSQEILGEQSAIGYFGPLTEQAVQRWQASHNIAASGIVGPLTRSSIGLYCLNRAPTLAPPLVQQCPLAPRPAIACLGTWFATTDVRGCTTSWRCAISASDAVQANACTAIAIQCPAGTRDQVGANCSHSCVANTSQSGSISASPTSGAAPLTVTFSGTALNMAYALDFGDGTPLVSTACSSGCGQLTSVQQTHIYTSAGTYTAKLTSYNQPAAPYYATATVTVTVGGSTNTGFSVNILSPVSGQNMAVGSQPVISWQTTNQPSGTQFIAAIDLYQGNGGAYVNRIASSLPASGSYTWNTSNVPAGSYQVGITVAPPLSCPSGLNCNQAPGYVASALSGTFTVGGVTITGGGTNSQILSATPSSGQPPLSVTFSTAAMQQGSYSVYFGDGTLRNGNMTPNGANVCAQGGCYPSLATTHVYSTAGTYTATLYYRSTCTDVLSCTDATAVGTATIKAATPITSCPVYSPPLCDSNQHLVGGAYNSSSGCYGAPQCVAN